MPDIPTIVAHRGASRDAPENTLAAFTLAWQQGADAIETDLRLTKDGKIVCIHDPTTERVTDRNMVVRESPLAELRQLDVGAWHSDRWIGERIPTIEEVLAAMPAGKRIFLEIKCGPEILARLKKTLLGSELQPEQTVIISFSDSVVREAKQTLPHAKSFWLTAFKQDEKAEILRPSIDDILATLRKTNADGLDCKAHPLVNRRFADALHGAGKELHVWTVDRLPTARRLQALRVDSLTTNRPGWMKQRLRG